MTDAPDVVEHFVSTANMDVVRQHRFERIEGGTYLSVHREWAWNYSDGRYNDRRNTMSITVASDGTVTHDGRQLAEYARARTDVLTDKRFGYHADMAGVEIVRTR